MTHGKNGISEHEIQAQILDWLKLKRIFAWRNNTGGFGGTHNGKKWFVKTGMKGSPDIYALVQGRLFGIEVKSDNGFQSQVQKEFEVEFTRAGGKYLLCFSLDDAIRGLNGRA